jgi:hypothetical protein
VKLLFDHNLSHKLVARLADIYPDSTQTRLLGFARVASRQRSYGFASATAAPPPWNNCCGEMPPPT